ncbi:MAG: HEPN domain-containing protein [Blautia sp.]|nr:HEPN domain-containing protein [Blautia sp.]
MEDRQKELTIYRVEQAEESLKASKNCFDNGFYKDSINRSYYSAFYAIKAVLALGTIDFKRHKDVIAYFNKEYIATEIFPRTLGRKIGILKQIREESDYDDFYIASRDEALEQIETAEIVLQSIKGYLAGNIE